MIFSWADRTRNFLWKWAVIILSLGFYEGDCCYECENCGCPFTIDEEEAAKKHVCWIIDTDTEIN